jgi:arginase family enzyme
MLANQTHKDTHKSRPVTIGGSHSITSHAVRDFVEKDGGLDTAFKDSDL